ncbi:hypothetical protein [Brevundimonas sp. NIBR10]|uniref:hypothetical protein n=1 Tax=Brevundimonas sp. NIBR10 TaxID=3015997 RepID=UPI0022F156BC|nr:hypothetical protein [Brevundimonas sp. NIBR10]
MVVGVAPVVGAGAVQEDRGLIGDVVGIEPGEVFLQPRPEGLADRRWNEILGSVGEASVGRPHIRPEVGVARRYLMMQIEAVADYVKTSTLIDRGGATADSRRFWLHDVYPPILSKADSRGEFNHDGTG